jgi:2-polyprenyl-3-methyl-5-hydroxy-6-metoxy-1,4-benzoquinol methylase
MNRYQYQGKELDVFARASNWKRYFKSIIKPYIGRSVLEVGAGKGATTIALYDNQCEYWLCSEPDENLRKQIDELVSQQKLPACCHTTNKFIHNLDLSHQFNTILYIDVLEHIEDDANELFIASQHLEPGGYLVVLSPAYQWLFSDFDHSIGHFRRYERASLLSLTPPACNVMRICYLDSVGVLPSLANRIFLKQSVPTSKQIDFWDRLVVPMSKIIDPLVGFNFGRSIISTWRKNVKTHI